MERVSQANGGTTNGHSYGKTVLKSAIAVMHGGNGLKVFSNGNKAVYGVSDTMRKSILRLQCKLNQISMQINVPQLP